MTPLVGNHRSRDPLKTYNGMKKAFLLLYLQASSAVQLSAKLCMQSFAAMCSQQSYIVLLSTKTEAVKGYRDGGKDVSGGCTQYMYNFAIR